MHRLNPFDPHDLAILKAAERKRRQDAGWLGRMIEDVREVGVTTIVLSLAASLTIVPWAIGVCIILKSI